ncbi:MAG: phosphoribosylformylglycinamidine synthase subunit PurL [Caldilineaceae bacterium]|nr:phosphoribosylformylglycinamidine synthase subunit PurL [Caldilineaceae bacterium]
MALRIEVSRRNANNGKVLQDARRLGIESLQDCRTRNIYFLSGDLSAEQFDRLCAFLLTDPVTEEARRRDGTVNNPCADEKMSVIEVALRPGVTDVTARELERGMVELGLPAHRASTATRYELIGDLNEADLHRLARQLLCNETIEHYALGPIPPQFETATTASDRVEEIPLDGLDEEALLALSKARLLSLNADEMRQIQEFYEVMGRAPTDVELETLAQTWSEHCVHKTFKSTVVYRVLAADGRTRSVREIDGLLKTYIQAATEKVKPDWLRSAFVDNAGIIAFDDEFDLAFKVETHNHPSALEPFGGANTGVGGVVRDIIGVSARPIATTDVLCFGPQDLPLDELPAGLLHPQRIAEGVVAGIGDYGNKLGLPTVNGAVLYDKGYIGNPLVFCGCVGLLPTGKHPTVAQLNDRVVVLGGRTGRDGLHGATFSSAELTHETSELSGSAVQIGDPITEKGLIELIEAARDEGLYNAITDCGAGGLSSAIGEMGEKLGVEVELRDVPLKYPGLTPWEIWLSEAQERIVIAVPPEKMDRLRQLAALWDVEVSDLGYFSGSLVLTVRYDGRIVAEIPMEFLHDGLPARRMFGTYQEAAVEKHPSIHLTGSWADRLLALLSHPNVASKEAIVRRYDHEVRGGTLVRPFVGPHMDGPGDAAVLKPLGTWHHDRAFALSVGINPLIGRRDPYSMAISAIDEAVRNLVAVGADPDRIAILDNFCWGNPTLHDRLGTLVRACQGCYDGALAYRTPFISGKDSLYNEFNGNPIPGTLLISAIGLVPDMNQTCTSNFKASGNRVYLLGETKAELGGSLLFDQLGIDGGRPPTLPVDPLARYRLLHSAIGKGWVRACHDLSEGGLAVALAEMALGGRLGATVEIGAMDNGQFEGMSLAHLLFGEGNGRLLLEVDPTDAADLEAHFVGQTLIPLGEVTTDDRLTIHHRGESIVDLPVEALVRAWKNHEK